MGIAAALVAVALTITTQNVRYTLPPEAAHHDLNQAAQHSSIVFAQEMGLRQAYRFAPPGFGTSQFRGIRQGDCATYWKRSVWHPHNQWIVQLSHAPVRAGTRYALVVILRSEEHEVATVCLHSLARPGSSPARRAAYRHSMARVSTLLTYLSAHHRHVIVGGDWNRGWPQRHQFAHFGSVRPPSATGPHGGTIDYFQSRRMVPTGIRVLHHTRSDHNGVREHFRLLR